MKKINPQFLKNVNRLLSFKSSSSWLKIKNYSILLFSFFIIYCVGEYKFNHEKKSVFLIQEILKNGKNDYLKNFVFLFYSSNDKSFEPLIYPFSSFKAETKHSIIEKMPENKILFIDNFIAEIDSENSIINAENTTKSFIVSCDLYRNNNNMESTCSFTPYFKKEKNSNFIRQESNRFTIVSYVDYLSKDTPSLINSDYIDNYVDTRLPNYQSQNIFDVLLKIARLTLISLIIIITFKYNIYWFIKISIFFKYITNIFKSKISIEYNKIPIVNSEIIKKDSSDKTLNN